MDKEKPSVIAIKKNVKTDLDKLKIHHRETYSEVIERIISPLLKPIQETEKTPTTEESLLEKKSPENSEYVTDNAGESIM